MKEEKFPHSRKPSAKSVCGEFWNLRGQHSQEKKKTPTKYAPYHNYKQRRRRGIDACVYPQLSREAQTASLVPRVRTRPGCSEDNLRELM